MTQTAQWMALQPEGVVVTGEAVVRARVALEGNAEGNLDDTIDGAAEGADVIGAAVLTGPCVAIDGEVEGALNGSMGGIAEGANVTGKAPIGAGFALDGKLKSQAGGLDVEPEEGALASLVLDSGEQRCPRSRVPSS